LETDHTHLYDWIEQSPEQYALVAGLTPSKQIMCTSPHVSVHPTDTHSRCVLHATPLQDLLVVLHKRCVGLCQHPAITHPNKRMQLSIHNAFAQQNSFDCDVWTCYTMYHHVLQRANNQEPVNLFRDMNMKTPDDDKRFRSCHHAASSRVHHVTPAHHHSMSSHTEATSYFVVFGGP
jgi:hypothetical protein